MIIHCMLKTDLYLQDYGDSRTWRKYYRVEQDSDGYIVVEVLDYDPNVRILAVGNRIPCRFVSSTPIIGRWYLK